MSPEWFPDRLRELRAQSGLTQDQLAKKANMTREGVAQLETGLRSPTWKSVVALAEALGVPTDEFRQRPTGAKPIKAGRPPRPKDGAEPQQEAESPPKKGKK